MRILKVADVQRTAGAGMSGAMLANGAALEKMGHEVTYLFRDQLATERLPVQLRRIAVPWSVCLRAFRRAQKLDVVEIHEPLAAPYARLASARVFRHRLPPCVVLSHGLEDRCWQDFLGNRKAIGIPVSLRSRFLVRATLLPQARCALRHAAQVLVLNQADGAHLTLSGLPYKTVNVVANGVEQGWADSRRDPSPGIRVIYLGTWVERKGVHELVRAWTTVNRSHPQAALTIVGAGLPAHTVLTSFDAACRGTVTVIPVLEHTAVPRMLLDHDALVLPSWYEGMPLVALEAAAAGLAVIATAIPGTTDIFPAGEDDGAILFQPLSASDLAASIMRLDDDGDLLTLLQRRARVTASRFTWESSAAAFEKVYRKAVDTSSNRRARLRPTWLSRSVLDQLCR